TGCVGHGCNSGAGIVMCVALLISAMLAAVGRRMRVWGAPSWDLRLAAGFRAIRRREWVGTPSPGRLGISRT
ncbi:MAG: hypothetical protein M3353_08785, partial [Actinomycetota bacterium]|nr:hypothetical protein [Actinomycetota bacterium]